MAVVRTLIDGVKSRQRDVAVRKQLPSWGPGFFSKVVSMEDNMPEHVRIDKEYVHVSSMVGWCPRQYALLVQKDQPPTKQVTGGHRVMWQVGRSVEQHIRTQYMKAVEFVGVYGVWSCKCGRQSHTGFIPESKKCVACGTHTNQFSELALKHPSYKVVGNPDMLTVIRGRIVPVEIKSMAAKQFDALKAPLGDHTFQLDCYGLLARDILTPATGLEVSDTSVIIYTTKDFKYGSPYKEFHYKTSQAGARLVKSSFVEAKAVIKSQSDGVLPKRTQCRSMTCPKAAKCPVAFECFNQK